MWRDNPIYHRIGGKYYRPVHQIPLILRMLPSYILMGLIGYFIADLPTLSIILSLAGLFSFMLLMLSPRDIVLIVHRQRQQPMFDILKMTPLTRADILWGYFSGAVRRYSKDTGIPFIPLAGVISASVMPIVLAYPHILPYLVPVIGVVGLYLMGTSLAIFWGIVNRSAYLAMILTNAIFVILTLVWVIAILLILDEVHPPAILALGISNALPFMLAGLFLIPSYFLSRR